MLSSDKWKPYNYKKIKSEKNKEIITIRAVPSGHKSVYITISIGLTICSLIDFNNKDRVYIKTHPVRKNIVLVEKTHELDGYKISNNGGGNGSFLKFSITSNYYHDYKLSQTIIADYDIIESNKLVIDFSKLKWKK